MKPSFLLAATAGAVATALGLVIVEQRLRKGRHLRKNYRGADVIATAGVVLVLPLAVGTFAAAIFANHGRVALTMLGVGLATTLLGYIDDVYGDRHAGGLFGHARALLRGTFTTGMLKAGGGAVLGLAAAWVLGWRGIWVVVAGAVVALSSNFANLLDLRPGRVGKIWLPLVVVMLFAPGLSSGRWVLAALSGGVAVFLIAEMRERVMLGDTGAGLLGVVLGVGAIAVLGRTQVAILAAVLLALTLVSEKVSFTRVIEAVPPLRWLDHLGRRKE